MISLLIVASVMGVWLYKSTRSGAEIQSLAVLPFVNVNQDPEMEYLSDGVTETLINALSQLPQLSVMARSTVFSYKNKPVDPRKIGRDLKVQAIVTGRVLQQGNQLVISADLVKVADGTQLWGRPPGRCATQSRR